MTLRGQTLTDHNPPSQEATAMFNGNPLDVPRGGVCTCQLPRGPSSAKLARSLLTSAMRALALPQQLVDNGSLAVNELVTNVCQHTGQAGSADPAVMPELWMWARTCPVPQLVVSVFDADRTAVPRIASAGLLEERGRGLEIVNAVSACWGSHLSRCRLGNWPAPGKATWFVLPLPWPPTERIIAPSVAGDALVAALGARGIAGKCRSDDKGISMVQVGGLNVWVTLGTFSWRERGAGYVHHPLVDLHEVTEQVVRIHEESDPLGWPPSARTHARRPM